MPDDRALLSCCLNFERRWMNVILMNAEAPLLRAVFANCLRSYSLIASKKILQIEECWGKIGSFQETAWLLVQTFCHR